MIETIFTITAMFCALSLLLISLITFWMIAGIFVSFVKIAIFGNGDNNGR